MIRAMLIALPLLAAGLLPSTARGEGTRPPPTPGERACIVMAAWGEARGRPDQEIEAVARVVVNRTGHPAYPRNACEVFLQRGQYHDKGPLAAKARAALAGDGSQRPTPTREADRADLRRIEAAVDRVLAGGPDPSKCATHFYSPSGRARLGLRSPPGWAARIPRSAAFGAFVFHRLPGGSCRGA